MAIAATFMIRLVITSTKKAVPSTNRSQCAFWKSDQPLDGQPLAAPVCHRQKPMLMAPPNSRTMFQGISSSSLIVRILKTKNRIVATRMMALLFHGLQGGNERPQAHRPDGRKRRSPAKGFRRGVIGPSRL